jgi:hypothetical protein
MVRYLIVFIIIFTATLYGYSDRTERELFKAIAEKDIKTFKKIINEGYDYKQLYSDSDLGTGFTLLHITAGHGALEMCEYLIQLGLDVNFKSKEGYVPLHFATVFGSFNTVKLLIENGTPVDVKDNDGVTPLIIASNNKDILTVEYLIKKGANVNARDSFGFTPLHWICKKRCDDLGKKVAFVLLENGAYKDIKRKTKKNMMGTLPVQLRQILQRYPDILNGKYFLKNI